jgi:peptide/nickel transport system permease protein
MSSSLLLYAARRIALMIPLLLALSFVVFALIHLAPGDPVRFILGEREYDEAVGRRIRELYHLDQPIPVQYGLWLGDILRGDLGRTQGTNRPVADIVRAAMEVTISLAVGGLVVTVLLGVPAGIIAAVYKGTWREYAVLSFCFLSISTPSFLLALGLIIVFSERLRWLPSFSYVSLAEDPARWLRHLVLPSLAVGLLSAASVARMVRSSLLEVFGRDYILTARAKGVFEPLIVLRHALSNALIPVVTILGLHVGGLLSGAVIIETVFALPGLGRTSLGALGSRDFPVIQICVLIIATIHVLANLVTDLLYAVIDPRIKYR